MIITINLSKTAADRMRLISHETERTEADLARSAVEAALEKHMAERTNT